jgi:hypothetical protein
MHTEEAAKTAALVAVNTTLSPCVAGVVVFMLRAFVCPPRLLDVGGFCNGILGGLVSITAGCGVMEPWESLIIGFVGGFVYQGTSLCMRALKLDDVVDGFAVHGACGVWGIVAVGFFGRPENGGNGVFYGGDQLGTQLFAGFMIILWVGVISLLVFVPLRAVGFLRLGDTFQDEGADKMEHSPSKAYETSPFVYDGFAENEEIHVNEVVDAQNGKTINNVRVVAAQNGKTLNDEPAAPNVELQASEAVDKNQTVEDQKTADKQGTNQEDGNDICDFVV